MVLIYMARESEENMSKEKKPASPSSGAFAGGLFGALASVMLAQNLSDDVEGSMLLTLAVVVGGAVIGGLIGFFFVRSKRESSK